MTRLIILTLLLASVILTGCAGGPRPGDVSQPVGAQGTPAALPTAVSPTKIPPTNTLVMAAAWTATPIPSATPLPSETLALVVDVPDAETVTVVLKGDTLERVYTVRLLGITVPPNTPLEPWGRVAFQTVQKWLKGKVVRLVQDTTITNAAGELPRYVYVEDSLVNQKLLELGLAQTDFAPPDIKLKSQFDTIERRAKAKNAGLWGPDPTPTVIATIITPTMTTTVTITVTPALTNTPIVSGTPGG